MKETEIILWRGHSPQLPNARIGVASSWGLLQIVLHSCLSSRLRMKTIENGRKTPQLFFTFIFKYENESENGKAGYENERELTEY
jgi:hypothetical protein